MANVANLERLEALVDSLSTLTGKRRGELIEADNWNRLVNALTELARATLAERAANDVPPHSHADQVDLDWLDAKLRAIVLEGGFSDPAAQARFDLLTRRIEKLGAALDALSDRINQMQTGLSQIETRDVERETNLTSVSRKLDGVFNARDEVAGLRGSLRLIEGQVRTAADLSARLQSPDGGEIDFEGLAARIGELEGLQATLTLPGGDTFSADIFQRELAQLRAELVTETELAEALEEVRDAVGTDLEAAVLEEARAAATTTADQSIAALATELRAEQEVRITELEGSLPERIGTATGDLSAQILTTARAEREAELDLRLSAFATERDAAVEQRTEDIETALQGSLDARSAALEEALTARLAADLDGGLAALDGRVTKAEGSLSGLGGQIDDLSSSVTAATARIETVRRDLQTADSELTASLTERIARLESDVDGKIAASGKDLSAGMRAELDADLTALRRDLNVSLSKTARDAARTEVDLSAAKIRSEAAEIAGAEVESQMAAIREEAGASGAVTQAQLAGLVAEEVRRATADQSVLIRRELESFQPEIERIVDARLNRRG